VSVINAPDAILTNRSSLKEGAFRLVRTDSPSDFIAENEADFWTRNKTPLASQRVSGKGAAGGIGAQLLGWRIEFW
jgi:hypothetical protein